MNATDELRRLLDERGVEWYGDEATYWGDADAVESIFYDNALEVALYGVSPQQAIDATLGRGTCRMTEQDDGFGWWECSECGGILPAPDIINYCPNCGRKVVDE